MTSKAQVNDVMMGIPVEWRYNWCDGGWCACMGAANCSGRASAQGVTKLEWLEWVLENPNPNPEPLRKYDPIAVKRLIEAIVARKDQIS